MSWMFAKILTFLSSGFLSKILNHLENRKKIANNRHRIKADVAIKSVESAAVVDTALSDERKFKSQFFIFRLATFLLTAPFIIYISAIVFDSVYPTSYTVAKMPAEIYDWGTVVITGYFGVNSVAILGSMFLNKS